jgi:hypothetical protein
MHKSLITQKQNYDVIVQSIEKDEPDKMLLKFVVIFGALFTSSYAFLNNPFPSQILGKLSIK